MIIITICIYVLFKLIYTKFLTLIDRKAVLLQLFALGITLIGVFILYLTNKHQSFIHKPLAKLWRIPSYLCFLLALSIWLQLLAISAAVFIWLFTTMSALIAIPLISLIKRQGAKY